MAKRGGGYKAARNFDPRKKGGSGKPGAGRAGTGRPGAGESRGGQADAGRGGAGKSGAGKASAGKAGAGGSGAGKAGTGRPGAGRPATGRGAASRATESRGTEPRRADTGGVPSRGATKSGGSAPTRGKAARPARISASSAPRPRSKPLARDESAKARPRRERAGQGSNGLDDARTQLQAGSTEAPAHGHPGRRPSEDRVLERLEAKVTSSSDAEGVSFADLGLDPRLIEALAELGAEEPFPIQVATIPDALGGKHVLGRGRTGSGKTIAFGAALVQRLFWMSGKAKKNVGRPPRALILVPTRELALQLDRTIQPLARALGLFTTQIYGGVTYGKQNTSLKRGVDIVIGTPGRVEDLERRGNLDLSQIVITVLDEADEMSAMGFIEPVERLLDLTKPTGQRMLFSATLDAAVLGLVAGYMPNPAVHELDEDAVGEIEHRVLIVERREREAVLAQLAGSGGRVLIFRRMRAGAEELAAALREHGVEAVALHGDLTQPERTHNLEQFTNGRVDVLVATDVAARGIHVDDVRLVVQADPPDEYKTYLHRAGRTGRAGNRGIVITLVQPGRQRRMVELLERAEIDAPMIPASPGSASLDEFML